MIHQICMCAAKPIESFSFKNKTNRISVPSINYALEVVPLTINTMLPVSWPRVLDRLEKHTNSVRKTYGQLPLCLSTHGGTSTSCSCPCCICPVQIKWVLGTTFWFCPEQRANPNSVRLPLLVRLSVRFQEIKLCLLHFQVKMQLPWWWLYLHISYKTRRSGFSNWMILIATS
jgi:hypothetical protein